MTQIVSVNRLGYMLPLNFIPATPLPKSFAVRGFYEWESNSIHILLREEAISETFQLPMPEFGV